jgi:Tfp pilus assembly protein PilN
MLAKASVAMRAGSIGIKRIQWTKPVPSWKRAEAWRSKMRASRERFQSVNNAMTNAVVGAQADLASGRAELAVRIATQRMRDEALRRLEQDADDVSKRLDNIKTDITV